MTSRPAGDSLETPADRRRFVRQLLVRHFFSLIGCALCIFIATWLIANGIELARDKPWNDVIATWIVTGFFALFCWIGAMNTQVHMLDDWRDRLRPLPRIDGSEIVLERKRRNRFLPTVLGLTWLAIWTYVLAAAWPNPTTVFLLGLFFIIPVLLGLKGMWLPKATDWAPLVVDADGFEDRSGSDGRIAWNDVAAVNWSGAAITVKLLKPQQRRSDGGWASKLPRFLLPRREADEIDVHGHGIPSTHRAFRLMRAYWRLSQKSTAAGSPTITRAAR